MRLSSILVPLTSLGLAQAFRDASPFVLLSTSELLLTTPRLATSAAVTYDINSQLAKCPSDIYVVVSQPGVTSEDYGTRAFAPRLKSMTTGGDENIKSSLAVTSVVGEVNVATFIDTLERKCGAGVLDVDAATGQFDVVDEMKPRVVKVDFPALPLGGSRSSISRENDLFLSNLLASLPSSKFTVLYKTSPPSTSDHDHLHATPSYHMKAPFAPLTHMELKRDEQSGALASNGSRVSLPDGPLFERYAYFSPGLFMGLAVAMLLISILYVGISGLSSLEVSYAAFDKEMGPAAQKKN